MDELTTSFSEFTKVGEYHVVTLNKLFRNYIVNYIMIFLFLFDVYVRV